MILCGDENKFCPLRIEIGPMVPIIGWWFTKKKCNAELSFRERLELNWDLIAVNFKGPVYSRSFWRHYVNLPFVSVSWNRK